MVLFLVVGVILLGIWIPAARGFWQYVPQTITALLGVNGLSFGIVEIRKAIEYKAGCKKREEEPVDEGRV